MSELDVRFVRLEPMRIASVRAFGESPEGKAWETLRGWAQPMGLLDDIDKHPVFGFNNPAPSGERKEYGYEFWIRITPEIEPEGEIEAKEFEGGLYAVTTCRGLAAIGETWMKLWRWVQSGECRYKWRQTHELEKAHDPRAPVEDLVLDLYLPIEE